MWEAAPSSAPGDWGQNRCRRDLPQLRPLGGWEGLRPGPSSHSVRRERPSLSPSPYLYKGDPAPLGDPGPLGRRSGPGPHLQEAPDPGSLSSPVRRERVAAKHVAPRSQSPLRVLPSLPKQSLWPGPVQPLFPELTTGPGRDPDAGPMAARKGPAVEDVPDLVQPGGVGSQELGPTVQPGNCGCPAPRHSPSTPSKARTSRLPICSSKEELRANPGCPLCQAKDMAQPTQHRPARHPQGPLPGTSQLDLSGPGQLPSPLNGLPCSPPMRQQGTGSPEGPRPGRQGWPRLGGVAASHQDTRHPVASALRPPPSILPPCNLQQLGQARALLADHSWAGGSRPPSEPPQILTAGTGTPTPKPGLVVPLAPLRAPGGSRKGVRAESESAPLSQKVQEPRADTRRTQYVGDTYLS